MYVFLLSALYCIISSRSNYFSLPLPLTTCVKFSYASVSDPVEKFENDLLYKHVDKDLNEDW